MLFKDLIKVYKVYYVHITEVLERFASLPSDQCKKAFEMYQGFVKLTENIKNKASKLVYQFNFPIQLPDFYNPEKELVETLRLVCNSNDQGEVKEIAKKVRGGMNRN
jgi:ANTH domain